MNCHDIILWLNRARWEQPAPEVRLAIISHVGRCPRCAGRPGVEGLLSGALYEGPRPMPFSMAEAAGFARGGPLHRVWGAVMIVLSIVALAVAWSNWQDLCRRLGGADITSGSSIPGPSHSDRLGAPKGMVQPQPDAGKASP